MITVLGVGNILLTDEGFGVHTVSYLLKHYSFGEGVELLDGGTAGMELLAYMQNTTKLLVIDAVDEGKEPGTIFNFNHEEAAHYFSSGLSVHEVGVQDLLRLSMLTDSYHLEEVHVCGVQPLSLDISTEMTPRIKDCVKPVAQLVIQQLNAWGIEVHPK